MKKAFFLFILALFLSACATSKFVQSSVQTNNEGIFVKAKAKESFRISFQNSSSLESTLDKDLAVSLERKGLKQALKDEKADYELLLHLIDFKKHSYAQRIRTGASFFYDFNPFEANTQWLVENFYTLQVNVEILSKTASQKTSIIARTAYLNNKKSSQLSLENKIISVITDFFYMQDL